MLVVSRKNGQKIMINDNIVITVVDSRNGQCKIAIEADRDVKIYREEIYYQIKLANLVGKNSDVKAVNSVSNMVKDEQLKINKDVTMAPNDNEIELDDNAKSKKITIKKQYKTDL